MISKRGKQLLTLVLASALIMQPVAQNTVYADTLQQEIVSQETLVNENEVVTPQLQDGTAVIPQGADIDTVKEALAKALIANADDVDAQSLEWEYECEGKNGLLKNTSFGSIEGFTSETGKIIKTKYTHPSLPDNAEGDYKVRFKESDETVTLHRVYKLASAITLIDGAEVGLKYTDDDTVDYDAFRESIFNTVIESVSPDMTIEDVTIEYYATATSGAVGSLGHDWMPLEGGKEGIYTYPAITTGDQKIRI